MSKTFAVRDNTGRMPLPKANVKCSACAIINADSEGHMMLNNAIKFPNNIGIILDFGTILQSRKYKLNPNPNLFLDDKPDTYPLFCATDSGTKFSAFGDNFLQINIRTFLCSIANYTKACELKALPHIIYQKRNEIILARRNLDGKTVNFNAIKYEKLNVKWLSGICDLYNISHDALYQIINKKCSTYKLIPQMTRILNRDYTFSAELVLNALYLYNDKRQQDYKEIEKYQILKEKIFTCKEQLLSIHNDCPAQLILSKYIQQIINAIGILVNDKDTIVKHSYDENEHTFLNNILINTFLNIPYNIDLYDKDVFSALHMLIYHIATYEIKSIKSDSISTFCTYFFQTFINEKHDIENVMEEEYLYDVPQVNFDHNISAICDRYGAITNIIERRPNIISLLTSYKSIPGLSEQKSFRKYIDNPDITFKELQNIYLELQEIILEEKNIKSHNEKKYAQKYLYNLVKDNLQQSQFKFGVNVIIARLLNEKYILLTNELILWFNNNYKNTIHITDSMINKIIAKQNEKYIKNIEKEIQYLENDNIMITKEIEICENDDSIIMFYDTISDNEKKISDFNDEIIRIDSKVIERPILTKDILLSYCEKYNLCNNAEYIKQLVDMISLHSPFPHSILSVININEKRILNMIYNELLNLNNSFVIPKSKQIQNNDDDDELITSLTSHIIEPKCMPSSSVKKNKIFNNVSFDTKRKNKINKRLEEERIHRLYNPSTRSKQRTYELERREINKQERKIYREQCKKDIL